MGHVGNVIVVVICYSTTEVNEESGLNMDVGVLNILILDDEPMLLDLLQQMLHPHQSVTVGSFHEACEVLQDKTRLFDIVLSDLMMPQGNGLDLYNWLGEHRSDLQHRLLFLTGGVTQDYLSTVQATSQPVLLKPFTISALHAAVQDLMSDVSAT